MSIEKQLFNIEKLINEIIAQNSIASPEEFQKYLLINLNKIKIVNKIFFFEDINFNNSKYSKDELNFVLGTLLYIKNIGTIEKHADIHINEIKDNLDFIKNFSNNGNNNNKINHKDNKNGITFSNDDDNYLLNQQIENELNALKETILDDFKKCINNVDADINNILSFIMNDNWENINKKMMNFLRL